VFNIFRLNFRYFEAFLAQEQEEQFAHFNGFLPNIADFADFDSSITLKNEIDYPKRLGTFSTIKHKYLNQMINIVREEQKIACPKRSDQLH
jgi:hypothetical protein